MDSVVLRQIPNTTGTVAIILLHIALVGMSMKILFFPAVLRWSFGKDYLVCFSHGGIHQKN